ncbi:MAG: gamma-glutamyl-gamma-aminobutyrate hydrolase family protein, partial [Myxococcota bacterium]
DVWRNTISAEDALRRAQQAPGPSLIVLSPGPGDPEDAGCCVELARIAAGVVPIFGVCLGHQAIVRAFGGTIERAPSIVHGKTAAIEHDGAGIFAELPSPMTVGRYHSLVAGSLGDALQPSATLDGLAMAVRHEHAPVIGVQFHPESILTRDGGQLIDAVLRIARDHHLTRSKEHRS